MTQQYDESIKFHKELIDIDPYSHIAWYNLGYALSANGDHENARDAFEYAFIINDKFEFAYRECAESCIQLKDYNEALKCYNELQEYFDPDSDLLMKIGLCHEALGHLEKAKSFLLKAMDMDENNDEVYFHLGNCFFKEGNSKSAITAFKKAMLIDGLKEEYYLALAEVYFQTKQLKEAENFFQKATDVAPETNKCWIDFARFLMKTGKDKQALSILEEAELYAFGTELLYGKIAILFAQNNRYEAFGLLQKALTENYNKRDSLFELVPELKDDLEIQKLFSTFN